MGMANFPAVLYDLEITSNHNELGDLALEAVFYMTLKLHQTTTNDVGLLCSSEFYMTLKLHQTTTVCFLFRQHTLFYMTLKLHQTTTGIIMVLRVRPFYMTLKLHQTSPQVSDWTARPWTRSPRCPGAM